jgi:hypothetical protein
MQGNKWACGLEWWIGRSLGALAIGGSGRSCGNGRRQSRVRARGASAVLFIGAGSTEGACGCRLEGRAGEIMVRRITTQAYRARRREARWGVRLGAQASAARVGTRSQAARGVGAIDGLGLGHAPIRQAAGGARRVATRVRLACTRARALALMPWFEIHGSHVWMPKSFKFQSKLQNPYIGLL